MAKRERGKGGWVRENKTVRKREEKKARERERKRDILKDRQLLFWPGGKLSLAV